MRQLTTSTFAEIQANKKLIYREIEEFLSTIFYHLLQTNPKEKAIVILESFMGLRALTEAITIACFKSFGCKSVYNVLSNIAPLYSTGMDSGIVVDVGFQQA